jgi:hypothetical protein
MRKDPPAETTGVSIVMKSLVAVVSLFVALALAACGAEREEPTPAEPPAAQVEQPAAPAEEAPVEEAAAPDASAAPIPTATVAPAEPERWLLTEFDWGDTEAIVYESVEYTDGFLCYEHKLREHCAFVKTLVDGEELLAKFEFVEGLLWRIEVLTPDLEAAQADAHLERIWKLLVGYVTRFHGEAPVQADFPKRETLAKPNDEVVTRLWELPEQEIRIVVGRAKKGEKWFTSARFTDPKWAKQAPPPEEDKDAPKTAAPSS